MTNQNRLTKDEEDSFTELLEKGADPHLLDLLKLRLEEAREEEDEIQVTASAMKKLTSLTNAPEGLHLVHIASYGDTIAGLGSNGRGYVLKPHGWSPLPELPQDAKA